MRTLPERTLQLASTSGLRVTRALPMTRVGRPLHIHGAITLRSKLFLILAFFGTAPSVRAQELVSDGLDQRFEALNAVFRFRNDLRDSGTVIAKCRLFDVERDSSRSKALDTRFLSRLVLPATKDSARLKNCGESEFAESGTRVLWLDGIVEITRAGELRPADQKQFEITFQLLLGPGYREWQRYLVGPTGVVVLDPKAAHYHYKFAGWRVLEYKFLGGDFDWGTDIGASAGFRRE